MLLVRINNLLLLEALELSSSGSNEHVEPRGTPVEPLRV
jgi:hypothetical protein